MSENAEFAKAVEDAGIVFIGPTVDNLRMMADKTSARKVAIDHGIPVVPGTPDPVSTYEQALSFCKEVGVILGLVLGIISALHHNSILDTGTTVFAMLGSSIPSHVVALALLFFLAFRLDLFPLTYSSGTPVLSSILPTIALAISPMAMTARFTRNEMIEVMSSEYILLAETKGMKSLRVILVHGLKNTLVPLITTMGPMLMGLLTGSTVCEQIFSIPGIGSLFITAIQSNDYNIVITLAFIYSAIYIGIMLVIDILYGIIDPRIRLSGGKK